MRKTLLALLVLANLFSVSAKAKDAADVGGTSPDTLAPLPNGGVTPEWCDIASAADRVDGATVAQSLRHRIEIYNEGDDCRFWIYFLFRNQTIRLDEPLILEKNLHDRDPSPTREVLTGTYVSGYGPGGVTDKLGITIDATAFTQNDKQCAFILKGGFAAKQQIHGITVLTQNSKQVVCDENGVDLLAAVSSNGSGTALGRDLDFKDITVMVQASEDTEDPTDDPTDDPTEDPTTGGDGTGGDTPDTTPPPAGSGSTPSTSAADGCKLRMVPGEESNQSSLIFIGLGLLLLGATKHITKFSK